MAEICCYLSIASPQPREVIVGDLLTEGQEIEGALAEGVNGAGPAESGEDPGDAVEDAGAERDGGVEEAPQPEMSPGDMLLELAQAAECGLEPVAFSVMMRGRCPFHYGRRDSLSGALEVDRDQARFHCRGCGVRGGSYAFAARLWSMSVSEARERMTDDERYLGATRPPGLLYGRAPRRDEAPRPQNTAVLTRAWWMRRRCAT